MGRETRQQRRARQRREMQQRRHKQSSLTNRWSLLVGGGIVFAILVLVAGIALAKNSSNSSSSINLTPIPAKSIDGLGCNANEQLTYHQHAHVNLIVGGRSIPIPAGIGILLNTDHECLYWLHTHGPPSLGVIHIEAPGPIVPTLGDFFDVWHEPLTTTRIWKYSVNPTQTMKIFVNLKVYTGNVRNIPLRRHTDITIEIGPPFVPQPKPFDFAAHQL